MTKFVLTQSLCKEGMEALQDMEVVVAGAPDPNAYLDVMQEADALIVRIASCDAHVIQHSPKLKVIGRTGVGYDSVDVQEATKRGIPVVLTPGANQRSVAEHALAMMFALSKNLWQAQRELLRGNWEIRNAGRAFELLGKRVGLLGLGAIGRDLALLCQGCGMRVQAYDPFVSEEKMQSLGVEKVWDLEKLYEDSDILSIHVPLTEQTRNMIDATVLQRMKSSALLINCSRGGIVDELALLTALQEGWIAGAGSDVFCQEPVDAEHPLLHCPNFIASPHAAAQTREAVVKMALLCTRGCRAILEGKKWPYVADLRVYDHPRWIEAVWAEVEV